MSTKIHQRVAPGIYRLASGRFRVKVAVGDRRHGGRQRETTFPADAGLREMKAWQTHERARLLRQGIVPARGMLEADVPSYLSKMKRKLSYPRSWSPLRGVLRKPGRNRVGRVSKRRPELLPEERPDDR